MKFSSFPNAIVVLAFAAVLTRVSANEAANVQPEISSSALPESRNLLTRFQSLLKRVRSTANDDALTASYAEADSAEFAKWWTEFDNNPNDNISHLIVKYTTANGHKTILNMVNTTIIQDFPDDSFVAIQVPTDQLDAVMKQLILDPEIEAVDDDSLWIEQGSMDAILWEDDNRNLRTVSRRLAEITPYGIKLVQGDQVSVGSTKVTVCVVDTGVAQGHPDLDFTRITGVDHTSSIDGALLRWNGDTRGHGTHTAGTIAARANNGIGVRGMGAIPLYITRGLNNDGNARESDVRDGLDQCERAGAKVISLSLAGTQISDAMTTTLHRLYDNGALIFAASGNGGGLNKAFPAADPKVISVGAVTEASVRWSGSNYGWNELMAPGNLVTSTSVNSLGAFVYANYSGTSMAAPHAAGAAALLMSNFPACTNTQIRYALAYTAKDAGSAGCDSVYGYGIVQTKAAYNFLSNNACKNANWGKIVTTTGQCSSIDVQPTQSTGQKAGVKNWWSNYHA